MTSMTVLNALRFGLIASVVALLFAPMVLPLSSVLPLTEFLTMLTLAMAWNLLAGYANLMTVGQHAMVGAGSYAFYGFSVNAGFDPYIAVLMASLIGLLLAIVMLGFVFRLRHAYFAIGTWVAAHVCLLIASKLPGFGGGAGLSIPAEVIRHFGSTAPARFTTNFYLALVLALLMLAASFWLLHSRLGLALAAMRDNEEAAGAIGISVPLLRISAFLFVAPFLAAAGALIAIQKVRLTPVSAFSLVDWTGIAMFIVVIGGVGRLEGPILGAIVYFVLRHFLADYDSWYLIALGATAIVVMVLEPGGLWGWLRQRLNGDILPVSHRLDSDEEPRQRESIVNF